jgi:hypothetical protein
MLPLDWIYWYLLVEGAGDLHEHYQNDFHLIRHHGWTHWPRTVISSRLVTDGFGAVLP